MAYKKNSGIHVVSLSAYTRPKIVEDKRSDFVAYGEDNLHFNFLIDRYVGSTTNQAIINGKANMVFGKGLWATDANKNIEDWAMLKGVLSDYDLNKAVFDRILLGMCALMITKVGTKVKMTHWPMDTLRAGKANDEGEIDTWYYHPNWKDRPTYRKSTDDLKEYPAWDPNNTAREQILVIRPYVPGFFYYPPVDYEGALPYALLEEEIADYLINDVQNGFSGTKVINYNNGVPSPEEQRRIVDKTNEKLTGSKGLKTIVAFNRDETKKTTVDDIPLNNAPEHYRYLSEECEAKLLKGHKAPSELLGFKGENAGFANNAEELKNKMIAFDNYQIKPYQMEIISALDRVFATMGLSFNLYFKTIEPLEFSDHTPEEEEEDTQLTLSKQVDALANFISKGEDVSDEWEVIDERDVDYDQEEDFDLQVQEWSKEANEKTKPSALKKIWKFISTGTARTNVKSEQDEQIGENYYRVRYKYVGSPNPQRAFCRAMISAGKLYRKEDILALEDQAVNPGWGPNGTDTYSIWKYKGGGNCYHRWQRVTFRNKSRFQSIDPDDQISNAQARRDGMDTSEEREVTTYPRYLPNRGFLPSNPQG